ncbi:MAG TPA: hypothetical protein DDZ80_32350 [Cyanobacteria bacterium UBA8803]|nr:hypothetical protein [Cyanobacteria bacterium UBA9273]HBL62894.1 hypothetical protein [Cyanobacteria bacterium UBA8803]
MRQPNLLNNSPTSERSFFAPMLLIALALHGAVLMLPTGGHSKSSKPPEEQQQDKVQPAVSPSPQVTPQISADQPESEGDRETPTLAKQTSQTSEEETVSSKSERQTSSPKSQQTRSQATSTSQKSSASPASQSKKASNTKSSTQSHQQSGSATSNPSRQQQSETSNPSRQQQSETSNPSRQQPPETSSSLLDQKPLAALPPSKPTFSSLINFSRNFPYYLGSWLTSGGILKPELDNSKNYIYYTLDDLKAVTTNFEEQLKNRDFVLNLETDEENFKVYKISKGDITQFLHLVSKDGKTAIFLDSNLHSLDKLDNKKIETENGLPVLVEFYDTFKQKVRDNQDLHLQKLKPADLEKFTQHEALQNFNKETGKLEVAQLLLDTLEATTLSSQPISFDIEQLGSKITSELGNGEDGFKVEKVDTYGGGNLYEIAKGDFKIYMILVSTSENDGSRTGILLFKNDPRLAASEAN